MAFVGNSKICISFFLLVNQLEALYLMDGISTRDTCVVINDQRVARPLEHPQ